MKFHLFEEIEFCKPPKFLLESCEDGLSGIPIGGPLFPGHTFIVDILCERRMQGGHLGPLERLFGAVYRCAGPRLRSLGRSAFNF